MSLNVSYQATDRAFILTIIFQQELHTELKDVKAKFHMTKETLKVAVEERHSQEKSLKVTFIICWAEYVCAWLKVCMILPNSGI